MGGGRTRDDVSLEATLRRELAEETPGLEVDHLAPYALEEATSVDGLAVPIQVFQARWSGNPETVDLQEGVLRWFAPDMLGRLNMSPGLGDLIRQHAAEHPPAGSPPSPTRLLQGEAPQGIELHIVGVHLYLEDSHGRILLGLRHPDSAYAGNTWHFLAGHCEREEEAGLVIEPDDVELVHLVHLVDSPSARPRIGLIFRPRTWSGTPVVREPDRCVEWRFWNPKDLPDASVTMRFAAVTPARRRPLKRPALWPGRGPRGRQSTGGCRPPCCGPSRGARRGPGTAG